MPFMNTSDQPIAYRDDAGKHHVGPGETFELVGAQHAAAVLAIPGVEDVGTVVEPAAVPTLAQLPDAPASSEGDPVEPVPERPDRRTGRA